MILYLDSSALVKLFVAEEGSQETAAAVDRASECYTHLVAYAEVRAELARALRMGRLAADQLERHKAELAETWQALAVVLPDEALIREAGDLAERFALRGYDSVHLAAARALASRLDPAVDYRFATFDQTLLDAARSLGLQPVGPGENRVG